MKKRLIKGIKDKNNSRKYSLQYDKRIHILSFRLTRSKTSVQKFTGLISADCKEKQTASGAKDIYIYIYTWIILNIS